jgi:hypothetical protein
MTILSEKIESVFEYLRGFGQLCVPSPRGTLMFSPESRLGRHHSSSQLRIWLHLME